MTDLATDVCHVACGDRHRKIFTCCARYLFKQQRDLLRVPRSDGDGMPGFTGESNAARQAAVTADK